MNFSREIGFVVAAVATAIILHLIPYDQTQVALYRFDNRVRQDVGVIETLSNFCAQLEGQDNRIESRYFLRRFTPENGRGTENCRVLIETSHANRFYLRDYWHFSLFLETDTGRTLVNRSYQINFPRPLCLLPLAMFLLALVFNFKPWGLGWTLGTYLFLLGGSNLIQTTESTLSVTYQTFSANPTFLGLMLITLWISLLRSRQEPRNHRTKDAPWHGGINRAVAALVGLWNPTVFTVGAKLFLPFRGVVGKFRNFLDGQMLVITLSLYLLSMDFENIVGFVEESLLLPRYFSFAIIVFISFKYLTKEKQPVTAAWRQTRFWRGLIFCVAVELLSFQFTALRTIPTIVRLGISLVISELVYPWNLSFRGVLRNYGPWALALFAGSFIFLMSVESGITDLVFVLWEPRAHPNAVALFTFVTGIFLGFLTGNFSTTFFTVYSVLMIRFDIPLVKAALIDGILAGSLLSPFSLFNLLPSAQFSISLQEMIRFRVKQMFIPLGIAILIYAVCAINSVAILQPVTFVFLCLVGLAFELKKGSWQFGAGRSLLSSRSAER